MTDTDWNDVLTGSYEPVKLSRDKAAQPKTVKRVLRECYGTEAADVIAALVWALVGFETRENHRAPESVAGIHVKHLLDVVI
jgi:hypothetical protein